MMKFIEKIINKLIETGERKAKQNIINSEKSLKQTLLESEQHTIDRETEIEELKQSLRDAGDFEILKSVENHEKEMEKLLRRDSKR